MKKITITFILTACFGLFAGALSASNPDAHFEFLRKVFNQHEKNMEEFLRYETEAFMKMYPDDTHIPEASYLLAEIYLEDGDEDEAFAQSVKTLFLYPNSNIHSTIVGTVHKIITDRGSYKDMADTISSVIDGDFKGGSMADRAYRYIRFLHAINIKKLYDWTLAEAYDFTARYKEDDRTEQVQRWIADTWYDLGKEGAAVNGYLKYEELYPGSRNLPYVMIKRANIINKELKESEKAIELLINVVEKYPGTDYAATAMYDRATIKQERLNDYEGAIEDFRASVKMKPQHPHAVDALMEIARIQEKEMKAYKTAIKVYDEIIDGYPVDIRGVEALKESADISEKLDDYKGAADRLAKIATQFPDYEDAPRMAFKAADIARGKMKNLSLAIEYLEILTTQFPDSEASRDAQKEIAKLKEKLNK